ncbi:MAG: DUF456 domain-containing protein [Candidatus Zixiibacteriota bacterium]
MTWYEILLFIFVLLIMLGGLIGTVVPVIPGAPVIFVAAVIYALIEGFESINGSTIGLLAVMTGVAMILDWAALIIGVKRMGGTYFGVLGAFIGLIIGIVFFATIASLIIGPLIGAILFEMLIGKTSREALRAGIGSFIGFLLGGALKFAIAAAMIGIFVWNVLLK